MHTNWGHKIAKHFTLCINRKFNEQRVCSALRTWTSGSPQLRQRIGCAVVPSPALLGLPARLARPCWLRPCRATVLQLCWMEVDRPGGVAAAGAEHRWRSSPGHDLDQKRTEQRSQGVLRKPTKNTGLEDTANQLPSIGFGKCISCTSKH